MLTALSLVGGLLTATASAAPVPTPATERAPGSTASGSTASGADGRGPVVPRIAWAACGAELPAFQCATVEVPTDYDRPRGATTTIALTRLPAANPGRRIGTLFTNPGGPGGSGVDFVQSAATVAFTQQVRDRFDILGFDPRGVSRSDPATCYPTQAEENQVNASAIPFPLTRAEVAPFQAANREFARRCAQTSPDRFRHISTANVARDMDLLRGAVGDEKLNYAGYSYGTFVGATYAKLFPNRIRTMVLDGTLDPREYSGESARFRRIPLGNRIEQDRGGAEVFEEFLRQCRRAGAERCSLAAAGDPAALAEATFEALKQTPRQVTLPDGTTLTVTYQLLVALAYTQLYSPTQWSGLADTFVAVAPSTSAARRASVAAGVGKAVERIEEYPSVGGSLGSTCVDTRQPRPGVYPAAADRADRRFPDFGRYRTWVGEPCYYLQQFGIRDTDAYRGPWQQTTKAKVLVLGTRHDPATPYRNTRPYAGLFPRADLVTLEGWGHTTVGQSRCVDARITGYLLDPSSSRRDQRCATDLFPFTPAAQQAEANERVVAARRAVSR